MNETKRPGSLSISREDGPTRAPRLRAHVDRSKNRAAVLTNKTDGKTTK
jgi:hypothetical protein